MKKTVLWAALATVFLAGQSVAAIRVAVEDGNGAHGGGAATVAQLNDDTWFDFDAVLVSAADIDTEAELSAYCCVILGGSGFNDSDWTPAMAAALRAFVEGGGGVVGTGWVNFDIRGDQGEDADLEAILPGRNIPSVNEFQAGTVPLSIDVNHPVTDGLSNFAHNGSFTEVNRQGAEGDDTVLGTIVGFPGDLSIIVKEAVGLGKSVYLGPVYMADVNTYGQGDLRIGDADRLLEQAVAWACGGEPVPTLEMSWGHLKSNFKTTE
jgi:uncharacterized membrane protein